MYYVKNLAPSITKQKWRQTKGLETNKFCKQTARSIFWRHWILTKLNFNSISDNFIFKWSVKSRDMNQSFSIRAGFLPVHTPDYFRTSLVEKGAHIVQHIFNVQEILSGFWIKASLCFGLNTNFIFNALGHTEPEISHSSFLWYGPRYTLKHKLYLKKNKYTKKFLFVVQKGEPLSQESVLLKHLSTKSPIRLKSALTMSEN